MDLVNLADLWFLTNLKIRAKISKSSNILVRLELQNCFHSNMLVLIQSTFFMFRVGWIYWSLQTEIIGIHIIVFVITIRHYKKLKSRKHMMSTFSTLTQWNPFRATHHLNNPSTRHLGNPSISKNLLNFVSNIRFLPNFSENFWLP